MYVCNKQKSSIAKTFSRRGARSKTFCSNESGEPKPFAIGRKKYVRREENTSIE